MRASTGSSTSAASLPSRPEHSCRGGLSSAWRALSRVALIIGLALVPLASIHAGESAFRSGEIVEIPETEVVTGDFYVAGNEVTVHCDIPGDLFVAANKVIVTGDVGGAVYAAGNEVTVSGSVQGTVRVTGNRIAVDSPRVGRDLFAAGNEVAISDSTTIEGGSYVAGNQLTLAGTYTGTVRLAGQRIKLGGHFQSPLHVEVGGMEVPGDASKFEELTVEASAKIDDEFTVHGRSPLVEEGATIAVEPVVTVRTKTEKPRGMLPSVVRTLLSRWLQFTGVGLLFALLFPSRSRVFMRNFGARPVRVLLMGPLFNILLLLAAVAVVLGCAAILLGLGMLEFGEPMPLTVWVSSVAFVMLVGGGVILTGFVAPTLFGGWLTRTFLRWLPGFRGDALVLPMITGGLVVAGISIIPIAGGIVLAILCLFTAGIFLCGTLPPPAYTPDAKEKRGYERIR